MTWLALDDAAVIEASRTEPERFASLFDRHAPHIHRYLARRVGSQAADDLVAETFLVAFGKRAGYDPRFRDARPWLYGIATNLVGQHRREEVRQFRLRLSRGPAPVQDDDAERAVVNLTAQSVRATLDKSLAALAKADQDVLLLIAWEQLSYDEVESDYILPEQRAALYQFMATTPGLIVEPGVRDISGRPGVGVGWSFDGSRAEPSDSLPLAHASRDRATATSAVFIRRAGRLIVRRFFRQGTGMVRPSFRDPRFGLLVVAEAVNSIPA